MKRPAYTLVELAIALLCLAVLLGLAAPPLRRALAWTRVRAARDVVAAQAARARALAVARGGAELVLDLRHARAWLAAADTATPAIPVADERLVRMSADGADSDTLRIAFDGVGLGRVASRTLRFRTAGAEARLTLSGYGRVRLW